ncbi:MAG: VOC family protein [Alphaproteobacteria bacterium]|nr:VOC family protein [Alphaproteobacteria bacterium]
MKPLDVRFDHVGLVARDPARTAAFYCTLLQGEEVYYGPLLTVQAGAVELAISPLAPGASLDHPRDLHVGLRVPPEALPALKERLARLGAPFQEVDGRLYTRDPDGLTVEFDAGA